MDSAHGCKQVLVVDDEHDVQEAITEVLADGDYSALVAGNGLQALEQLHALAEKPCAILLDLKMPVMDGFEFHSALQAHPALKAIPVIVLTANYQAAEVGDLGATAFVRKPFEPEALLDIVSAACAEARMLADAQWCRVADDPERWERAGFGAVEARGPMLWAALPNCGHDHYSAVSLSEAQHELDQRVGLCFGCWYRTRTFARH
jgi:CheY-like chemotaxis protein